MAEVKRVYGKRILVVDDDQAARESLRLLLSIDRHEVVEAASGPEAIQILIQEPFDLAIVDYFMPGMQGNQVAVQMRAIAPTLRILMVTAYVEKLGEGDKPVDAVLGKPFAVEDLRQAIARLVG